jgi:uncharacterized protein (UPF0261 family)
MCSYVVLSSYPLVVPTSARALLFAERLTPAIAAHARRTVRLTDQLQQLAFALGGEAGTLIVTALGMPASPATLLRIIRRTPTSSHPTPRVLETAEKVLWVHNL